MKVQHEGKQLTIEVIHPSSRKRSPSQRNFRCSISESILSSRSIARGDEPVKPQLNRRSTKIKKRTHGRSSRSYKNNHLSCYTTLSLSRGGKVTGQARPGPAQPLNLECLFALNRVQFGKIKSGSQRGMNNQGRGKEGIIMFLLHGVVCFSPNIWLRESTSMFKVSRSTSTLLCLNSQGLMIPSKIIKPSTQAK